MSARIQNLLSLVPNESAAPFALNAKSCSSTPAVRPARAKSPRKAAAARPSALRTK